MKTKETNILIIGAGLTGLTLAYLLRNSALQVTIIEGRSRVGGRIFTKLGDQHPPLEMGATWFGNQHRELFDLLQELNIEYFGQVLGVHAIYEPISTSPPQVVSLPPNNQPSFRIAAGSDALISRLLSFLKNDTLYLNEKITNIQQKGDRLLAHSELQEYNARHIVSTLPPLLFHKTISTSPTLPPSFTEIADATHTWMGDSIKVGLTYEQPFWRNAESSGTIFSNVGPIPEMYDHSNIKDSLFALVGFFNGNYFSVSVEKRKAMVLQQLEKYYGEIVHTYLRYDEKVWRNDSFTFSEYDHHVLPHQHGGHSVYQTTYLNNQLHIAGAETAEQFPGYMEGAIRSAQAIYERLKNISQ